MSSRKYLNKALFNARKLEIGDLVTSYYKGYHIITKIIPRKDENYLVEHVTVLDFKFQVKKSRKRHICDAGYCKVITKEQLEKEREKQIDFWSKGYDFLINLAKNQKV